MLNLQCFEMELESFCLFKRLHNCLENYEVTEITEHWSVLWRLVGLRGYKTEDMMEGSEMRNIHSFILSMMIRY